MFTTNLSGTKSQAVNTGCLKVKIALSGDTKTFNVRSWIDYDVESFTGNLVSKVIVKSETRGNSMINYETNPTCLINM